MRTCSQIFWQSRRQRLTISHAWPYQSSSASSSKISFLLLLILLSSLLYSSNFSETFCCFSLTKKRTIQGFYWYNLDFIGCFSWLIVCWTIVYLAKCTVLLFFLTGSWCRRVWRRRNEDPFDRSCQWERCWELPDPSCSIRPLCLSWRTTFFVEVRNKKWLFLKGDFKVCKQQQSSTDLTAASTEASKGN